MMNILLDKNETEFLQKLLTDPMMAGSPNGETILAKIARANKIGRKMRLHTLNVELQKLTAQNYFAYADEFLFPLIKLCSDNGITCDIDLSPNDSRNYDLGSGIFLSVSTYIMPSGKVEIVAYFHG